MANRWQLQDASGLWLLQDGSGYWLLQDSVAGDDVADSDSGALSEQTSALADSVAPDTGTLAEAVAGRLDAVTPESAALSESPLGLLAASAVDAGTFADAATSDALVVASDSASLSESGVGALGTAHDDVIVSDSGTLAEIESLLAELSATDNLVFSEVVNEPAPPQLPTIEPERRSAVYDGWRIQEVPDEDEDLALASYVNWYY